MKILHVIDHWGLGGAQRALSGLVEVDKKNDHHVVVLFSHQRADWPLPAHGQPHFLARSYSEILKLPGRLRGKIRQIGPDLLHVHLTGSRFMTALALRRMEPTPPVIWHEHSGNEYSKRFGAWIGGILSWTQRRMAHSISWVVANSESSQTYCRDVLGISSDRIRVIGCTVIPENILSDATSYESNDFFIPQLEKPALGFVGRLAKQKGPFDFLNVASRLLSDGSVKTVWVIGDGPARRPMERRVSHLPEKDRVFFLGHRNDVYALIQCLDVVLMPSSFEPFGLVAAESIALNKPVVGYDVDGLSQVLRTNSLGIPVTPGNVEELCKKTRHVLERPPQAKWANGIPAYMDIRQSAEAWAELYALAGSESLAERQETPQ